jgi:hypothetical protein
VTAAWAVAAAVAASLAVIAATVSGAPVETTLYAYALFLGAVALLALVRRTREALPPASDIGPTPAAPAASRDVVTQLQALERRLSSASQNTFELHYRLRPLAGEIVRARLARRHGIDFDRQPERASGLVGARAWELVRPDRDPPEDRQARGWSPKDLEALIGELERV